MPPLLFKEFPMPSFTYGDSSQTGDDKYVIAQFRADANLAWVAELRAFLMKDELKYKWFHPERHRVEANSKLWKRVQDGVHQAEITIVDPHRYRDYALMEFLEQQAIPGVDFDTRALNDLCGDYIIDGSPIGIVRGFDDVFMASVFFDSSRLTADSFTPTGLKRRAGGKLKDAIVLAARSHAMIAPSEMLDLITTCHGPTGPDFLSRLRKIRQLARVFDVEHPKSLPILNEFTERLAVAAGVPPHMSRLMFRSGLVFESRSEGQDHIQAADIAAGWAVDLLTLTNGDFRTLAQRFAWVGVNGVVVPP